MPRTSVRNPLPAVGDWTVQDVIDQQWSRVLNATAAPQCLCGRPRVEAARQLLLFRVRLLVANYRPRNEACDVGGIPLVTLRTLVRAEFLVEAGLEPVARVTRETGPYRVRADETIAWALNQPDSGLIVSTGRRRLKPSA